MEAETFGLAMAWTFGEPESGRLTGRDYCRVIDAK